MLEALREELEAVLNLAGRLEAVLGRSANGTQLPALAAADALLKLDKIRVQLERIVKGADGWLPMGGGPADGPRPPRNC